MSLPPHIADIFQTMSGWFMKNTFADCTDRACAISAYRRNNEEVRDTIPGERLLVFNVSRGLGPALPLSGNDGTAHAFSAQSSAGRILGAFRRRASVACGSLSGSRVAGGRCLKARLVHLVGKYRNSCYTIPIVDHTRALARLTRSGAERETFETSFTKSLRKEKIFYLNRP